MILKAHSFTSPVWGTGSHDDLRLTSGAHYDMSLEHKTSHAEVNHHGNQEYSKHHTAHHRPRHDRRCKQHYESNHCKTLQINYNHKNIFQINYNHCNICNSTISFAISYESIRSIVISFKSTLFTVIFAIQL